MGVGEWGRDWSLPVLAKASRLAVFLQPSRKLPQWVLSQVPSPCQLVTQQQLRGKRALVLYGFS